MIKVRTSAAENCATRDNSGRHWWYLWVSPGGRLDDAGEGKGERQHVASIAALLAANNDRQS